MNHKFYERLYNTVNCTQNFNHKELIFWTVVILRPDDTREILYICIRVYILVYSFEALVSKPSCPHKFILQNWYLCNVKWYRTRPYFESHTYLMLFLSSWPGTTSQRAKSSDIAYIINHFRETGDISLDKKLCTVHSVHACFLYWNIYWIICNGRLHTTLMVFLFYIKFQTLIYW